LKSSRFLWNEAGGVRSSFLEKVYGQPQAKLPLEKPCTRVFREMTFSWSGTVPICCYDWSNAFIFGKVPEQDCEEIWNSQVWSTVRQLLGRQMKWRNFSPCDLCDYNGGFRIGFLPEVGRVPIEVAGDCLVDHMKRFKHYQYPGKAYHFNRHVYNKGAGYKFIN